MAKGKKAEVSPEVKEVPEVKIVPVVLPDKKRFKEPKAVVLYTCIVCGNQHKIESREMVPSTTMLCARDLKPMKMEVRIEY